MFQSILSFDQYALAALNAHRVPFVLDFFMHATRLGDTIAVGVIGLAIALALALHHRIAEMTGLAVALGGTALVSAVIKHFAARPRPDAFYQAYQETGYSFPSNHTALATALSVFLVYLIFRLTPSRAVRTIAICGALMLVAAVGFSRAYLGVHYASDVVVGFALGALVAGIGIMIERSFEHLRQYFYRKDTATLAD